MQNCRGAAHETQLSKIEIVTSFDCVSQISINKACHKTPSIGLLGVNTCILSSKSCTDLLPLQIQIQCIAHCKFHYCLLKYILFNDDSRFK